MGPLWIPGTFYNGVHGATQIYEDGNRFPQRWLWDTAKLGCIHLALTEALTKYVCKIRQWEPLADNRNILKNFLLLVDTRNILQWSDKLGCIHLALTEALTKYVCKIRQWEPLADNRNILKNFLLLVDTRNILKNFLLLVDTRNILKSLLPLMDNRNILKNFLLLVDTRNILQWSDKPHCEPNPQDTAKLGCIHLALTRCKPGQLWRYA